MADMLRSARGKFRKILGSRAKGGASAGNADGGQLAALEAELETYKHAFETTAADRDRLAAEVRTYKHAFETTAQSRDQLAVSSWSMADPLDAGYFRINMAKLIDIPDEDQRSLARNWDSLFKEEKYEELVNSILTTCGIRQALKLSNDNLRQIIVYWLACFFCRIRQFEKAQGYAELFDYPASVDGTDLLPYDIGQGSRLARYRQLKAIQSGRPSALIVSLPKSASAFLSQTISEVFEVPIIRVSIGEGMRSTVIPRWADQVAEGGSVTHEHFQALPENTQALAKSRIKKVWVLIRDPRDAAYSLRKMDKVYTDALDRADQRSEEDKNILERQFIIDCRYFSQWTSDWISASKHTDLPFTVSFLTFEEIVQDLPLVLSKMFPDHLDSEISQRLISFLKQWKSGSIKRRNFRVGKGKEWLMAYSKAAIEQANAEITESVRSVLNLKI